MFPTRTKLFPLWAKMDYNSQANSYLNLHLQVFKPFCLELIWEIPHLAIQSISRERNSMTIFAGTSRGLKNQVKMFLVFIDSYTIQQLPASFIQGQWFLGPFEECRWRNLYISLNATCEYLSCYYICISKKWKRQGYPTVSYPMGSVRGNV